jgi:hypothetical protein
MPRFLAHTPSRPPPKLVRIHGARASARSSQPSIPTDASGKTTIAATSATIVMTTPARPRNSPASSGSTTRYGISTTESGNVSPMIRPTTSVSAVRMTRVVRDSAYAMYADIAATTVTAITARIVVLSRATTVRPRIAARQKTRLVMATCSRWVN